MRSAVEESVICYILMLNYLIHDSEAGIAHGFHFMDIYFTVIVFRLCVTHEINSLSFDQLCKCKETAALKIKAAVSNGRIDMAALRRFFSFAVARQITHSFYFELLLCYLMSAIGMNRQECKHK